MKLECLRMPGTDRTLNFISPYLGQRHVQAGLEECIRTAYGMYCLFSRILDGYFRLYGVFDVDEPVDFLGFVFGHRDGETFEVHACWNRHVPTVKCSELAIECMVRDYADEGIAIRYIAGYIPDKNKAAQLYAKRSGFADCGLQDDKLFDGQYPCRKFLYKVEV